ncbi:putative salt-induced outer membrane protein [Hydrogenivirga caldilitoris]|uniref:Putative salt-induced outer membrane protein n=1 Tax=Hydrogenivirga caldilitoris TaxID=246264 RepID=A0A497XR26_9AQUI|nr:DUF481 domain-containing protein [Hydrogenivirga caldilitoris]RLJ71416.1 putative salt-induced outer membrane protein [Hydrogenivirga caldilitoris]
MRKAVLMTLVSVCLAYPSESSEEKLWSIHIEFSYVSTSGNVRTQTLSEKLEIKREGRVHRVFLKNSALYATQEGSETANRIDASARYERLFTKRFFGFLTTGYERDKFSGYEYKLNGGPGIGYDLLKTKRHELKLLMATPYYYNKVENDGVDNYASARAEVYYQWNIRENLKFKESANYLVKLSDTKTYFLNSETSLEVKVNSYISLGVGYKVAYQNKPPEPGIKRTDTTFSTSLIIDF